MRSIRTGKTSDVRFSSTERLEVVPMMTRKMEFSYKDGDDFVFSDPETFETMTLSPETVGEAQELPGGKRVRHRDVRRGEGRDHRVAVQRRAHRHGCARRIRGDSANNVQKPVILETGITVQAPLFIKTGEKIKINTRTGKYMDGRRHAACRKLARGPVPEGPTPSSSAITV